jgi:NAD(P)H-flavin reductase
MSKEAPSDHLRIIFRATGPFTKRLGRYLTSPNPVVQVELLFGPPLLPVVGKYRNVAIIAAGIGITPYLSLLDEFRNGPTDGRTLALHWFCRDEKLISYIVETYYLEKHTTSSHHACISVKIYHTGTSTTTAAGVDTTAFLEMESDFSPGANNNNNTGQVFRPDTSSTIQTKPLDSSAVGSGVHYYDNLRRFLLLFINSVVGLAITYIFFSRYQPRSNIWSRLWSPFLVGAQGIVVAIVFVFVTNRYSQHLRWHWDLLLASDDLGEDEENQDTPPELDPQPGDAIVSSRGRIQHHVGRVPIADLLDSSIDAIFYCGPNILYEQVKIAAPSIPVYKEEYEM